MKVKILHLALRQEASLGSKMEWLASLLPPNRLINLFLKRYLNPYLAEDQALVPDQIALTKFPNGSFGLTLVDLIFNAKAINAQLGADLPIMVSSMFVANLELNIFVGKGSTCAITARGVEIHIKPNPRAPAKKQKQTAGPAGPRGGREELSSSSVLFPALAGSKVLQEDIDDILDNTTFAEEESRPDMQAVVQLLDTLIRTFQMEVKDLNIVLHSISTSDADTQNVVILNTPHFKVSDVGKANDAKKMQKLIDMTQLVVYLDTIPYYETKKSYLGKQGLEGLQCIFALPGLPPQPGNASSSSKKDSAKAAMVAGITLHLTRTQHPVEAESYSHDCRISTSDFNVVLSPAQLAMLLEVANSLAASAVTSEADKGEPSPPGTPSSTDAVLGTPPKKNTPNRGPQTPDIDHPLTQAERDLIAKQRLATGPVQPDFKVGTPPRALAEEDDDEFFDAPVAAPPLSIAAEIGLCNLTLLATPAHKVATLYATIETISKPSSIQTPQLSAQLAGFSLNLAHHLAHKDIALKFDSLRVLERHYSLDTVKANDYKKPGWETTEVLSLTTELPDAQPESPNAKGGASAAAAAAGAAANLKGDPASQPAIRATIWQSMAAASKRPALESYRNRTSQRVSLELETVTLNAEYYQLIRVMEIANQFTAVATAAPKEGKQDKPAVAAAAGPAPGSPGASPKSTPPASALPNSMGLSLTSSEGQETITDFDLRVKSIKLALKCPEGDFVPKALDNSNLTLVAPVRAQKIIVHVYNTAMKYQMISSGGQQGGDVPPAIYQLFTKTLLAYLDRGDDKELATGKFLEINFEGISGETADTALITVRSPDAKYGFESNPSQQVNPGNPPLVNTYFKRKAAMGPFAPAISMFEGEEAAPKTLDFQGMEQFKSEVQNKALVFVELTLPFLSVELNKSDFELVMSLLNSFQFHSLSNLAPTLNQTDVDGSKRRDEDFTSFALNARVGDGQFVLREPNKADQRHPLSLFTLDFQSLQVLQVTNYNCLGTNFLCMQLDSFSLISNYPLGLNGQPASHTPVVHKLDLYKDSLPIFKLTTSSAFDRLKQSTQSQILIELHGVGMEYSPEAQWITVLSDFFTPPDGLVLPQPKDPAESRMYIKLLNSAARFTPRKHLGQAILSVDNVTLSQLTMYPQPPNPPSVFDVAIRRIELNIINDRASIGSGRIGALDLASYWKLQRYVNVVGVDFVNLKIRTEPVLFPTTKLDISITDIRSEICADAMLTVKELVGELTGGPVEEPKNPEAQPDPPSEPEENLADEGEEPMVAVRVEDDVVVQAKRDPNQLPEVIWLSEKRTIESDPRYLDHLPRKEDDFQTSKDLAKEIQFALVLRVNKIRLRLLSGNAWRDNNDTSASVAPSPAASTIGGQAAASQLQPKPSSQGLIIAFNGFGFQYLKDKHQQFRVLATAFDLVVYDRLHGSNWDKMLCYDVSLKKRAPEFDTAGKKHGQDMIVVIFDRLLNTKSTDVYSGSHYYTIKTMVLPLQVHTTHGTLEFIWSYLETALGAKNDNPNLTRRLGREEVERAIENSAWIESVDIGGIRLSLDYKGKPIDQASSVVDVINIIRLEQARVVLSRIRLHRLRGFDNLADQISDIWLGSLKSYRSIAGTVGSLRGITYFSSLGGAIADLAIMPYSEYQRGGTIAALGGFVGAGKNVLKTTAEQVATLGSKILLGAHTLASAGVNLVVGSTPPESAAAAAATLPVDRAATSPFAHPPANVAEGAAQGFQKLAKELKEARDHIIFVPLSEWEKNGAAGFIKQAVKAVPIAVLKPVVGATQGLSKVLIGVRNQLNQRQRLIDEDKYKKSSKSVYMDSSTSI